MDAAGLAGSCDVLLLTLDTLRHDEAAACLRAAAWTTFHPSEVRCAPFLAKCLEQDRRGVRFSVGVVGLREHFAEIAALRAELPAHVYLWVNAYKDEANYCRPGEAEWLTSVGPLFPSRRDSGLT